MDTFNIIRTLRHYLANDSTLRSLMGSGDADTIRARIVYQDGIFVQKQDFYAYPMISLKLMEDEDSLRGSDSNTVSVMVTVHNPVNNEVNGENAITANNRIKDRLKLLIRDKHEPINNQGSLLGLTLKVRDASWVGAFPYDDKELGSERLHKIICTCNFIVGD